MRWEIENKKKNQTDAFGELSFFIEHLDENIDSHLVIRAIFYQNEENMRLCPRQLVESVIKKIWIEGKFPQYLALLMSITNVGEKNIAENQFEVVKHLLDKTNFSKVSSFLCPVSSKEYSGKKVKMMEDFIGVKNV